MRSNRIQSRFVAVLLLLVLGLGACGPDSKTEPTSTPDVQAIFTQAFQTIQAGQTATALSQPTPVPTATNTLYPTVTPGILEAPTLVLLPSATYAVWPTATLGTVTATLTGTPTSFVNGCYNSALVSEEMPFGDTFKPGQSFKKTWRIENTGTVNCGDWAEDSHFTFIGGDLMGSDSQKIKKFTKVGSSVSVTVSFVAPSSAGTYTGYWQMSTKNWELFGTTFSVSITVVGPTETPVPPTDTPVP
jgi:hypothetical protein